MNTWLWWSLVAAGMWSLWGFLGKLASRTASSLDVLLVSSLGRLLVLPILVPLWLKRSEVQWKAPGYGYALLAGLAGGLGSLAFYRAVAQGETSRVVAVTATYPALTAILSFLLLRESVTVQKVLGIGLALCGIYFLSR